MLHYAALPNATETASPAPVWAVLEIPIFDRQKVTHIGPETTLLTSIALT